MLIEPAEVKLRIGSCFEDLDLVDVLADAVLRFAGLSGESLEHATLAIREAAANAVQHGNGAGSELPVELSIRIERDQLVVRVRDAGEGFDLDALPDPLAPENLLKPKGRGIFLMKRFMDEVEFEFDTGTVVTMRKSLGGPLAAAK